jgi:Ca2+-binding RTX toxin-like protein
MGVSMNITKALRVASVLALLIATSGLALAQQAPTCNGKTATIHGLSGTIDGTEGDDVIVGSANSDQITAKGGNDTICGLGGSDVIRPGLGDDYLDGGSHVEEADSGGHLGDTVSYVNAPNGVTVDLQGLGGFNAEGEGIDIIVNTEQVAGSDFDDTLRGDSGPNRLGGFVGDDVLFGRDGEDDLTGDVGADILSPGAGDGDIVDGGEGDDTVSYRGATGAVQVSLFDGVASGSWGSDSLTFIENAAGSNFADTIVGDDTANQLLGYKGDDTINGLGDADLLDGGKDDDNFHGGGGQDSVFGGPHGARGDTASFDDAQGNVTADLSTGLVKPDGWGSADQLHDVENLFGSFGAVNFTGDNGPNKLTLCNESDKADGGGGRDIIFAGLSNDVVDGGGGDDTIYGENGNDTITGGPGDDILLGGNNNDTLTGNGGFDNAEGEKGVDYCDAENEVSCEKGPKQDRAPTARWGPRSPW